MKYTTALFCLAGIVASAECASIAGRAGIDRNEVSFGGSMVLPRIPFLNGPPRGILPPRPPSSTTARPATSGAPSTTARPGNSGAPSTTAPPPNSDAPSTTPPPPNSDAPSTTANSDAPSTTAPPANSDAPSTTAPPPNSDAPSTTDNSDAPSTTANSDAPSTTDNSDAPSTTSSPSSPSNRSLRSIAGLSAVQSRIPAVNAALESARTHVQAALNITTDLATGIEEALAEAFNSSDPAAAIATLAETVINAYVTAAENCPLLIGASRILQEGIRLSQEIAQSAANIIFGTTSTTTESTTNSTGSVNSTAQATSASTESTTFTTSL